MVYKESSYAIQEQITPLFDAVRVNDLEGVKKALDRAGIYDSLNMTALMHAALHNYIDIVKVLAPLEGHLKGRDEETALTYAAKGGAIDVIKYLLSIQGSMQPSQLSSGCLENAMLAGEVAAAKLFYQQEKDALGITPLMWAAFTGDVAQTKQLVAAGDGLRARAHTGLTALMFAALSDMDKTAALLLEHEHGLQDEYELTALMHAAENRSVHAAKLLVAKELGMKTEMGTTALYLAAHAGCPEIVALTVEAERSSFSNGFSALSAAAGSGSVECVKLLLPYREEFAGSNETGLVAASCAGHADVVRLLIPYEAGLKVGEGDSTALIYAVQNGTVECVKLLREHELGHVTKFGYTALTMAAERGSPELVLLLLDEATAITGDAVSPLETCFERKNIQVAKLLLPYEKDRVGATDLMAAALAGQLDRVRELRLSMFGHKDSGGRTALIYAVVGGELECAKDLLGEAEIADSNGTTALMYAVLLKPDQCLPFLEMLKDLAGRREADGETALIIAAGVGNYVAVEYLSKYELRMVSDDNDTALLKAASAGHYRCIPYLMGEIDIPNEFGETALEIAKQHGDFNVCNVITSKMGAQRT